MNRLTPLSHWAHGQVSAKLGRCARCMRASLLGAGGSWLVVAGLALAELPLLLEDVALLVAASFSALVVAHALAYVYRPMPVGGGCCGKQSPRLFVRRPVLQAVLSLPAAFGVTQVLSLRSAAAADSEAALQPPPTMRTAIFRSTLTCPETGGPGACQCVFTAKFGYDFQRVSNTQIRVTRFTMTWEEDTIATTSGATCEPEINRGSGALDFQCVGDKQPCKFTGGNIFACPCDTVVQFVPLGSSTVDDCKCPNTKNKVAYAQGVCGAPVWIEKTCTFQWINFDFQHKVTCSCDNAHITRGFLAVVARFSDGTIQFGGDWVQGTGLP